MDSPVFHIPIDKEIVQFQQHLRTHPRTLLSAKFGDGKSYFIDLFEKRKEITKEFKFIKVYPVSYQVVSNNDIFTLLKYDILLQLLVADMVSDESIRDVFDGRDDTIMVLETLFDGFAKVDPYTIAQAPSLALKLSRSIAVTSENYRINKGGKRSARTLLRKLEKGTHFSLEDKTTKLIRQSIRDWRDKYGRKVVLVVEDLDRLDPSHLFRLLNVFSAHMDYIYRSGDRPNDTLVGSRFGFDSIVFVLEYENLKRLFNHFYGSEESFKGYINKFIPQGFFQYSLRKSANSYFYENISRITGMSQVHISILLKSKMNDLSLRDMANAVKDIDSQVTIHSHKAGNYQFLLMIAIMKRLEMNNLDIVQACKTLNDNEPEWFARYIIDFTYLDGFSVVKGKLKTSTNTMYSVSKRTNEGYPTIVKQFPVPDQMKTLNMHHFISLLQEYIIP